MPNPCPTSPNETRDAFIDFIRKDLLGPAGGDHEEIHDPPDKRYLCGALFHQGASDPVEENLDSLKDGADESAAAESKSKGDKATDSSATSEIRERFSRPSSMGMSFSVTSGNRMVVRMKVTAGFYEKKKLMEVPKDQDGKNWYPKYSYSRQPIAQTFELDLSRISDDLDRPTKKRVSEGLELQIVKQALSDLQKNMTPFCYRDYFRVTLVNTTEHKKNEKDFFQCALHLECLEGAFLNLPSWRYYGDKLSDAEREDLSLEMLYRKREKFASGHNCAVDWDDVAVIHGGAGQTATAIMNGIIDWDGIEVTGAGGLCAKKLSTSVIPSVSALSMKPRESKDNGHSMRFLSESKPDKLVEALQSFVHDYEEWIQSRQNDIPTMEGRYHQPAQDHIKLCEVARRRIMRGIELLKEDPDVFRAFQWANRAILMQQHHSRRKKRLLDEPLVPLPKWDESKDEYDDYHWRTFQLGYILMCLPSIGDPEDTCEIEGEAVKTRDLVDLIWFPTGGGKTEAYLGLSAFLIFLSRIRDPESDGCKILMRYTLRLLTSQQFSRAASMICACEVIRRKHVSTLGETPISIGLWVGESLTPNSEKNAKYHINEIHNSKYAKNPFQILQCPWCGSTLTDPEKLGYTRVKHKQRFVCPESTCDFHYPRKPLPICVVDETLYKNPSIFIIATVDKLAMLARKPEAGAIFARGGGPDLIIQDELHLITGPLGSMVGLYESVVDYLCSLNSKPPKIIASTATIRRAKNQCHALYNRKMFQFPPSGLDASDCFFATESQQSSSGRVHLGVFGHSSALLAQIRVISTLLSGPFYLHEDLPYERIDPYYTLVSFFTSLRDLGRISTLLREDVQQYRKKAMESQYSQWPKSKLLTKSKKGVRFRYVNSGGIKELTGRCKAEQIPVILSDLGLSFSNEQSDNNDEKKKKRGEKKRKPIDVLLATNMISVGVDVPRLGLMLMISQPKSTAEYIQASSRVGRSEAAPGVVVSLLSRGRQRDRSHYESFKPYHNAYGFYVEPATVTPYTPQALKRGLPAVYIIAARNLQAVKTDSFSQLPPLSPRECLDGFMDFLTDRVRSISGDIGLGHLSQRTETIMDKWESHEPGKWEQNRYDKEDEVHYLMGPEDAYERGQEGSNGGDVLFSVPTSLRNVDSNCEAFIPVQEMDEDHE